MGTRTLVTVKTRHTGYLERVAAIGDGGREAAARMSNERLVGAADRSGRDAIEVQVGEAWARHSRRKARYCRRRHGRPRGGAVQRGGEQAGGQERERGACALRERFIGWYLSSLVQISLVSIYPYAVPDMPAAYGLGAQV